jgi:endogenous inhibitor of DNA gyrase (YacG/DUF329 family)
MKCPECDAKMELTPRRKQGQGLTVLYHECPECGNAQDHEFKVRTD